MVRKDFLTAGLLTALLFAVPPAGAQQSAPRVRLAPLPSTSVGAVAPSISLSEAAYVLVVAIDNSGQIEVLSPEMPGDVIRFEAAKSIQFPEFYAGFSNVANYEGYGSRYRRASFNGYSDDATANGSVLVIASRTPLNFSRISDGLYWDEEALRQIVRYRTPGQAVTALGRALTAKGQAFGHDYVYFGRAGYSQFASSAFSVLNNCVVDYSFSPYGYSPFVSYYGVSGASYNGVTLAAYGNMGGPRLIQVGSDGCGRPRYMLVPVQSVPPADTTKTDSVAKPAVRSAIAGTYTGEDARRVYESLLRNHNSSDTYVGIVTSPVYAEKEARKMGAPAIRDGEADRQAAFQRAEQSAPQQIDRSYVVRREQPTSNPSPTYSQPVTRPEPMTQSAPSVQREAKPAEVVTRVKDN